MRKRRPRRRRVHLPTVLVTPHAPHRLAGHHGREAPHALDGPIVRIQGDEQHRPPRRHLEVGRPVRLHRHRAHNALQEVAPLVAYLVHPAVEVDRLGQRLEDQEFPDLSRLDARHVSPAGDVGQEEPAGGLARIDPVGDYGLSRPGAQGPGLVCPPRGRPAAGTRDRVDHLLRPAPVHQQHLVVASDEEEVLRQWTGVAIDGPASPAGQVPHRAARVRPAVGVDEAHASGVLPPAVPGRVDHHDPARARDRLGVDEQPAGVHVAEQRHGARAVGIERPEVMEGHVVAVDVLPARVKHPPVGQDPRRVLLLHVGRYPPDVAAVGPAAVQDAHGREPARHPAAAPAGDEDDVAAGRVGGLDVVERPVGKLVQAGPVSIDLVQVVCMRPSPAVREQDLPAAVVNLGISNVAAAVRQQGRSRPVPQVQPPQRAALAAVEIALALGRIAEVRVPVAVLPRRALGEDDLLAAEPDRPAQEVRLPVAGRHRAREARRQQHAGPQAAAP